MALCNMHHCDIHTTLEDSPFIYFLFLADWLTSFFLMCLGIFSFRFSRFSSLTAFLCSCDPLAWLLRIYIFRTHLLIMLPSLLPCPQNVSPSVFLSQTDSHHP